MFKVSKEGLMLVTTEKLDRKRGCLVGLVPLPQMPVEVA